jgi:uncharacterized protein (TIGR02271 family)
MSQQGTSRASGDDATLLRSEEQLSVGTTDQIVGAVRARKHVDTEAVRTDVARSAEHGEFERAPANDDDSGEIETLADGSVSIPLLEERLVVRKEVFVRERVVLRKHIVTEQHEIDAELRKERIEIDADDSVADGIGVAGEAQAVD